jgi:hypothetical protein
MSENRVFGYFDTASEPSLQPLPEQQGAARPRPPSPHTVQWVDILRAAQAQALFDHQLGKLFNPGSFDE